MVLWKAWADLIQVYIFAILIFSLNVKQRETEMVRVSMAPK